MTTITSAYRQVLAAVPRERSVSAREISAILPGVPTGTISSSLHLLVHCGVVEQRHDAEGRNGRLCSAFRRKISDEAINLWRPTPGTRQQLEGRDTLKPRRKYRARSSKPSEERAVELLAELETLLRQLTDTVLAMASQAKSVREFITHAASLDRQGSR